MTREEKLAKIEGELPELLAGICDDYCMYPQIAVNEDWLEDKCESCPMQKILGMIWEEAKK